MARRAALLGVVSLSACLNPMPDDFPNDHDTTIDVGAVPGAAGGGSSGLGSGESGPPQSPEPVVDTPEDAASAPPSEADAGVPGDAGPGDSSGRR